MQMTDSFWSGGPKAHYDGMKVIFEAKLAELNATLVDCEDPLKRQEIEQEILAVQAEFKEKLKEFGRVIY